MLKAVLFDLDDTLIDWSGFNSQWEKMEALRLPPVYKYLGTLGTPSGDYDFFREEYVRRVRDAWGSARSTLIAPHLGRILVETSTALGISAELVDEALCLDHYAWGVAEGTCVFEDVVESLEMLRAAGLRFGIVTNAFAPMAMRDLELKIHGLLDYFPECRFSAADVGWLKPHPDIFEAALNCLGLQADEVVFVGDNLTADIAGAQSAGMKAILRVKNPPAPMISGLIVPDAAINTLVELEPIFDEWFPGWKNA